MAELRYNPLLKDWTMVAASRQNRPHMPKDFCPFCPGSGKVPDHYDVHLYHNDFPVLSPNPPLDRMQLVEACIKQEKRMGNVKWFCIHPATTIPSRIFHGSI